MESMENSIATLEVKNDTVFVSGAIDFDNVLLLWQQGIALIDTLKDAKEIKVDLKALKESDSSGVALLTGWVRVSQEKNKTILFMNMPTFMQDILQVCGLEDVLPVLWEN
ncbi:MAG TPA: STAS domain-containing protein [Gammaproteobacteria bacterium]|nr:STAS domain-containing protein [Gammaproteobacteria bacterium]